MNSALINLLHLTDPTLPIGGFSHSAGLEAYVDLKIVKDVVSAKEFVVEMLSQNIHHTDAAFASLAFESAEKNDLKEILELDDECTAVKLPSEIRTASQKLGIRLVKIFQPSIGEPVAARYLNAVIGKQTAGNYCVVFGVLAQAMGISRMETLSGFYYNAAVGFVTNCVKLIPLSQQAGQELLFSLHPLLEELAGKSMNPEKELIGRCCPGFDIRSMQHEQMYSRLYMS